MKIAQISDLHFGCTAPDVVAALRAALRDLAPDLVIASGDITQDGTAAEFAEARAFFDSLTPEVLAIPGNHDLPGLDLRRFVDPFARYRRFISTDLEPERRGACVDVKGLNSARMILPHPNWANGAVSARQCRDIAGFFEASTAPWRMLVLHHPLVTSRELPLETAVFGRQRALAALAENRIDLVLAGHQHHAFAEPVQRGGHTTVFVNASTATSTRLRKQPNGFNLLEFTASDVRVSQLRYGSNGFEVFSVLSHSKR
jgi:3',5'-cyclic AMP phosphodiesterase CpdA